MTVVIVILAILAGAFLAAAIAVAIVKKLPALDALKVVGLASAFGLLTAAAVAVAILRRKNSEGSTPDSIPADSGSASIGTAFDETRDSIRAGLKAILRKAGGR